MIRALALVFLLIILCIGASIGYFNTQTVEFFYLAGSIKVPLIVLVIGVFLTGVAITFALLAARLIALKGELRRLRRRLHDQDVELKNLRNLPTVADGR